MASQPVMDAAARESRANAREDMAVLTSGAREKVDGAMASMQAFGQTLLHPMDQKKKEEAQAVAQERKQAAREKRDEIRSIAAQQAGAERVAARSMVAKGVSETGGARYPVLSSDHPQELEGSDGVQADDYQHNHPPIDDKPIGNHSDTLIDDKLNENHSDTRIDAHDETAVPHINDIPIENRSDTPIAHDETAAPHMGAPKPEDGLSRETRSGEIAHNADTEGAEDADFYPSP